MARLEIDNSLRRVLSEVAVRRESISGVYELILEIDDGIVSIALPKNRV